MNRQPDGPGLAGNGPRHALANPPEGIGGELVAAGGVELFNGPLETEGSLLDQIEQLHALALVFLRHAHHKPKIGAHHPLLGSPADLDLLVLLNRVDAFRLFHQVHHRLNLVAELDLFGRSQQRLSANRGEIPGDGITPSAAGALPSRCDGRGGHGRGRNGAIGFVISLSTHGQEQKVSGTTFRELLVKPHSIGFLWRLTSFG